jgi:hypothetical protein
MTKPRWIRLFGTISVILAISSAVLLVVLYPSQGLACPYDFPPAPLECYRPQIRFEVLVAGWIAIVAQVAVALVAAVIASRKPASRANRSISIWVWVFTAATAVVAAAAVIFLGVTRVAP